MGEDIRGPGQPGRRVESSGGFSDDGLLIALRSCVEGRDRLGRERSGGGVRKERVIRIGKSADVSEELPLAVKVYIKRVRAFLYIKERLPSLVVYECIKLYPI